MEPERWPATKTEMRRVADLTPYEQNPVIHTDELVEQLARSIAEFGRTVSVLVDEDGLVLVGHRRRPGALNDTGRDDGPGYGDRACWGRFLGNVDLRTCRE